MMMAESGVVVVKAVREDAVEETATVVKKRRVADEAEVSVSTGNERARGKKASTTTKSGSRSKGTPTKKMAPKGSPGKTPTRKKKRVVMQDEPPPPLEISSPGAGGSEVVPTTPSPRPEELTRAGDDDNDDSPAVATRDATGGDRAVGDETNEKRTQLPDAASSSVEAASSTSSHPVPWSGCASRRPTKVSGGLVARGRCDSAPRRTHYSPLNPKVGAAL